jgi:benzoate-CoA ligase family protein
MTAIRKKEETTLVAVIDSCPRDSAGAREIRFTVPEQYNASAILFDNLAAGRGELPAVVGDFGVRTYAQLCAEAARYGNALLKAGLAQGDRVLLFLDDGPSYPAAMFGAIRAGLVPILINTLTPSELLNFYLADSSARVAIVDGTFLGTFDAAARKNTQLETVVVVRGDAPTGDVTEAEFLKGHDTTLEAAETRRDDMAFWQYSSGSTGRPKGIVHLQHDMLYTALSYGKHVLNITENDICFSVPKIFFAYGLGNSLTFPFAVGASSVLLTGQPKAKPVLEAIAKHRPTLFFGLPTLYNSLNNAPEAANIDFSSIRLCLSAAEVLSPEVAEAWKKLSGRDIVEGLGSTEVLHIYLSNTAEKRKVGSAGLRVPGYEIALKDLDGNDVPDDEQGVLWVRGDSNAPTYWNRPDKTADTMRAGGWIYTGDRMKRDRDGFYFFLGRADDLVKVSGQWVYPLEVELCITDHPLVREAAVLALEMADRRMTLQGYIVLENPDADKEKAAAALKDHVKATLLPYKYPRTIVFLDALPKTGTGKIDRQALKAADLTSHKLY